jgi:hypothetical protein
MPDPIVDPPAIIRPDEFADRLTQLMAEARAFGRKTIEQKVACGQKLLDARAELDERNRTAKSKKDRLTWRKLLARFGFSEPTARRLMTAARSHNSCVKLTHDMDRIYDDGYDPAADKDKKPCRECRMRGKDFNKTCPGCRALNRRTPEPKADQPLADMDGNPIPEHLVEAFKDGETIREFTNYLLNGIKALAGLVERPGCQALNVDELTRRLKTLRTYALKYRLGLVHQECKSLGCMACKQRGWRTVMEVLDERAAASAEKARKRNKEFCERQRRSTDPLPE